jgi:uncharacterized protein
MNGRRNESCTGYQRYRQWLYDKGEQTGNYSKQWDNKDFELIISASILAEYSKTLRYAKVRLYHKLSDPQIAKIIEVFETDATLVEVQHESQIITADPSDNKFLACALAGNADYIVSGDKHLLNLGSFQGITILSPTNFVTVHGKLTRLSEAKRLICPSFPFAQAI